MPKTGAIDDCFGIYPAYIGNRTSSHLSSTYTYEPFNRMKTSQTSSHGYDPNGNMVSRSEGSKFWRYAYDYDNRMTRAADRRVNVTYKYDALGRRVERNRGYGTERSKFTHDGEDVLTEDTNGTVLKYQNGPGIDNKLSVKQGTTTNYFLADHLGSTNALTDSTGAITSLATYDSFGNATGTLATRYGFTGRERDDATGLMYYRARFYDSKLGRFVSEDPIGFDGGDINLFGYVNSSPTGRTDPYGLLDMGNFSRDLELARQATQGISPAIGAGGGALLVAGAKVGVVAIGGFAAGYATGYYPGQWTANSPYNPFVYGPLNPFGTPYNPYAGPMPQPQAQMSSKPAPSCQPATKPPPFYQSPPFSNPFDKPDDDRGRDICGRVLALCLRNPRQPKWNQKQYGKRKDCGACNRECRLAGGAWPFDKCPIQEF